MGFCGPQERREVEAALFGGTLMGVAATNALELGIDVGSLDVTLHLGFPGASLPLVINCGPAHCLAPHSDLCLFNGDLRFDFLGVASFPRLG